jgi:hypothetical protein
MIVNRQPNSKTTTADTPLDLALVYSRAGFSVLPIRRDGSKAPLLRTWDEFKERLPSRAEMRNRFDSRVPPGIAIVAGAVSGGLLVLDFEFQDFFLSGANWSTRRPRIWSPGSPGSALPARTGRMRRAAGMCTSGLTESRCGHPNWRT